MTAIIDEQIYTTKGYLPRSELDYRTHFDDNISCTATLNVSDEKELSIATVKTGYITFVETYFLAGTEEVVKRSVHPYSYDAATLMQQQGAFE
tara:strand:+ start:1317 stop:1595 length:279 start_codon:yes stop_codon:yes gene_type:complete